jgi:hypothetical protein
LISIPSTQAGYLALCFAWLLFSFSGLLVQGTVWFFVGFTSWVSCCLVLFGVFFRINFKYNTKYLKAVLLDRKSYFGRKRAQQCIRVRSDYSCPLPLGGDFLEVSMRLKSFEEASIGGA